MRARHPLGLMVAGSVVALALTTVIVLLTGGQGKSQVNAPAAGPKTDPRENTLALPRLVSEPVINADFADPDMIKVGATYYAYATNSGKRNLQVAKAPALAGPWTVLVDDGLPALGRWASAGRTWAPEVLPRPDGSFLLYYTARETRRKVQCIGAAVAMSPAGPFSPVGAQPLICPEGRGDTIDAAAFTDKDGLRYVLYRSGSGVPGRPTAIFLQRVGPDGLSPVGRPVRILTWNGTEPLLVEAPALVLREGRYHLFYANGDWRNATYRTGYATAESVTGPYRRAEEPLLSTERFGRKVIGPGGADLLTDESGDHIVFHGVLGGNPPRRGMYLADLGWVDDRPVTRGIPQRYQAESGRAVGAHPRADLAGASGGGALGYFDNAKSRVELEVVAPVSGSYTVRVRYANRSGARARHWLSVGRGGPVVIDYPAGPAGGWGDVVVTTVLRGGRNILQIRRISGQVDLDYLEIT